MLLVTPDNPKSISILNSDNTIGVRNPNSKPIAYLWGS